MRKIDELIDKILCFMKAKIEKNGYLLEDVKFNFSFSYLAEYWGHPNEQIPDGDDLIKLKNLLKNTNDSGIKSALNNAITHKYINDCHSDRKFSEIMLTSKGMEQASSALNATPKLNLFFAFIKHPIIVGVISNVLSFLVGCYAGGKQIKS